MFKKLKRVLGRLTILIMYPVVKRIIDRMKTEGYQFATYNTSIDEQFLKLSSYSVLKNARLGGGHIADYRHKFLLKFDLFAETCLEIKGFHEPEDWGTWGEKEAAISFLLVENLRGKELNLKFNVKPYLGKDGTQRVKILINGIESGSFEFKNNDVQILETVYNPILPQKFDKLVINFIAEHAVSPSEKGGTDTRKLSFGLIDLGITLYQ
jgi:hypothetical protein